MRISLVSTCLAASICISCDHPSWYSPVLQEKPLLVSSKVQSHSHRHQDQKRPLDLRPFGFVFDIAQVELCECSTEGSQELEELQKSQLITILHVKMIEIKSKN
jgi:hypothetical protein